MPTTRKPRSASKEAYQPRPHPKSSALRPTAQRRAATLTLEGPVFQPTKPLTDLDTNSTDYDGTHNGSPAARGDRQHEVKGQHDDHRNKQSRFAMPEEAQDFADDTGVHQRRLMP